MVELLGLLLAKDSQSQFVFFLVATESNDSDFCGLRYQRQSHKQSRRVVPGPTPQ